METNAWDQLTRPQQLHVDELKTNANTSLEGQVIEMVQEIFGDNFMIIGGFPVFLAGRTSSFGDVNFLLPKCYAPDSLRTVSGFNSSEYRSHTCDLKEKINSIPTFEEALAIKTYNVVSRFVATRKITTTANTLSSTVAARLAKANKVKDDTTWSGAIKIKTLANDYFPTKTNPHGPVVKTGERTVVLRLNLKHPDLLERIFLSCMFEKGHGDFFWNNTDMQTKHERHLLHDDIRCTKIGLATCARWSEELERVVNHDEMNAYERFESYKKSINTVDHRDFDTFRGATVVTVKLQLDTATGKTEDIKLFNLVFLEDVRALMNDKEYDKCKATHDSCMGVCDPTTKSNGTCVIKTCSGSVLFRRIAGLYDEMERKKRNLSPPSIRRRTKRGKCDYIQSVTNEFQHHGIDFSKRYSDDSDDSYCTTSDDDEDDDDDVDDKILIDDNDDTYAVKKLLSELAEKAAKYYDTGCIQCIFDQKDNKEQVHVLPSTLPVSTERAILGEREQDGIVYPSGQNNVLFKTLVDHVCNPVNLNICKHVLIPYRQKLYAVYLGASATMASSLSNNSKFTVGDVRKYEKRVLNQDLLSLANLCLKRIFSE